MKETVATTTRRALAAVRQALANPLWRLIVLPFIAAPLMVGKLIWSPEGAKDWVLLLVSLVPWVLFVLWLRRPTAPETPEEADGTRLRPT